MSTDRHLQVQGIHGQVEESDAPRFYFSTGSRLYELLYSRTKIGYREGRLRDDPLYALDYLSHLRELPFTGDAWCQVVGDIGEEGGRAAYFHVPPHYDPSDALGNFQRVTHSLELPDLQCLVLLRPSHTPQIIADVYTTYGDAWYVMTNDQPTYEREKISFLLSKDIERNAGGALLFDVFARGRYRSRVTLGVRLLVEDALELGKTLAVEENGIVLCYKEESDELEWLRTEKTPAVFKEEKRKRRTK